MFNRVKQYVNKLLYPNTYSNDRFCEYIREHGEKLVIMSILLILRQRMLI